MKTEEVRAAIRNRYADHRRYAVAEEVGRTTGGGCRRIDVLVMDCYWSNSYRLDGFEIKVSVSDLRRELENPDKHIAFFDVLDYFTLAAPAEVINPVYDLIPKRWGILIVNADGSTRLRRGPLALADERGKDRKLDRGFVASMVRAIQQRQPAESELSEAYERGKKEGVESEQRSYRWEKERLHNQAEKVNKYDEMVSRFELWGRSNDITSIMDEFERFRTLHFEWVRQDIEKCMGALQRLKEGLEGNGEVEGDENGSEGSDDMGSD